MNFLANPGITVDLPDASAPQVAPRTATSAWPSRPRAGSVLTARR